jgi:hypothetical protein
MCSSTATCPVVRLITFYIAWLPVPYPSTPLGTTILLYAWSFFSNLSVT